MTWRSSASSQHLHNRPTYEPNADHCTQTPGLPALLATYPPLPSARGTTGLVTFPLIQPPRSAPESTQQYQTWWSLQPSWTTYAYLPSTVRASVSPSGTAVWAFDRLPTENTRSKSVAWFRVFLHSWTAGPKKGSRSWTGYALTACTNGLDTTSIEVESLRVTKGKSPHATTLHQTTLHQTLINTNDLPTYSVTPSPPNLLSPSPTYSPSSCTLSSWKISTNTLTVIARQ